MVSEIGRKEDIRTGVLRSLFVLGIFLSHILFLALSKNGGWLPWFLIII